MINPVTLAVIRGRLEQIVDEMDAALFRSAFSPVIAEARDGSHGIYHAETGDTLVQGKAGLPDSDGDNSSGGVTPFTAGSTVTVTVQVTDQFWNLDNTVNGTTVTLTTTDNFAVHPSTRLLVSGTTAFDVVQVEERNREVAAEQLELSRQRYTLGADNFLVLLDAERTMADGERAYLDGLYAFHVELANLEAAVGQQLRPEE